jgi:hypothetical protein
MYLKGAGSVLDLSGRTYSTQAEAIRGTREIFGGSLAQRSDIERIGGDFKRAIAAIHSGKVSIPGALIQRQRKVLSE